MKILLKIAKSQNEDIGIINQEIGNAINKANSVINELTVIEELSAQREAELIKNKKALKRVRIVSASCAACGIGCIIAGKITETKYLEMFGYGASISGLASLIISIKL